MRILGTEWKTKAQSLAVFVLATAGLSWLATESTDFIASLPDWLEAPAYAAALAVGGLLTGYAAKHKPDRMSESAVAALMRRGYVPGRRSTIKDLSG